MKKDIHPTYFPQAKVVCSCGNIATSALLSSSFCLSASRSATSTRTERARVAPVAPVYILRNSR